MPKTDLAFQLSANASGMAAGVSQADRELSKVGASAKATSAEFRQAAKITQELRTPAEKYADTIGKLDAMMQKGLLTQEVYGRAVAKADAELKSATSSMDAMVSSASMAERIVNGLSGAIGGVADATKSVSDAGISVIKFGKDIAWTYLQWKVFTSLRNPAGLKDFAVGALKATMAARTMILAAKALGIGLAIGGGAAGTAAAAVLGLTNPLVGGALLTLNLGKAFLSAKDRALEMAAGITAGTVTLEQLNAQLGQVQAQQVDNLAFAMEEATAAGERSEKAFAGLSDVFVTPFVGAFAAITSGMAGLNDGLTGLVEGFASIASPIAQAIAPVFTLLGTIAEGAMKLVGVLGEALGVVLKVAGAVVHTFLPPFIVGLSNVVEAIRSGMNSAFEFIGSRIDWVSKKIQSFYAFMSKVPIIGRAFASGEQPGAPGGAAAPDVANGAEQAAADAAEAAKEEAKALESVNRAMERQHELLSKSIDQSAQFGQAGFDAATQYQEELRRLDAQLESGILNEESYARAAGQAKKKFDDQVAGIEERNRAAAEQAAEDRKAEEEEQRAISRQTDAFFEATENAKEFGKVGAKAAKEYEAGLSKLDEQLRNGQINQETYNREADKLKKGYDTQIDAADKAQKAQQKRDEDIAKAQEDVAKASEFRDENIKALGQKSNEALKANDLRSGEGMAQFLALAAGREDPAIAEYRKQNEKLQQVVNELKALQQQPVDMLGAAA